MEQLRPEGGAGSASDADLIERSLREPAVFGGIFDRHAAGILRYAHARLGPDLAEDVVAEMFLAAFGRRGRYDLNRADARPWLYGIATRQIGRHRRAEHRRQLAIARLHAEAAVAGGLLSPSRVAAAAARAYRLLRCLAVVDDTWGPSRSE